MAVIKKISELEQLDALTSSSNIIIEENGVAKRIPASSVGGYPDWSHLKCHIVTDSLGAKGTYTQKCFYDYIQEKTGIQFTVDAISATGYKNGEDEGNSFLDRVENIPEGVDIVIIFGSGNDISSTDLEYANRAIYDTLLYLASNRPELRVIAVPPTPWRGHNRRGEAWTAYVERLKTCALACNCRYVADVYDCPPFDGQFDSHMERFFTTDPNGVHPNEVGHEALAPFFYNALLQELILSQ